MRRLALVALVLLAAGCGGRAPLPPELQDGNPEEGRRAISDYGCGSCHVIPGVRGANSRVAPPLEHWAQRSFIAGQLANTPDNLVRWIQDPQEVEPGTAMPDLGVTELQARDIAAYLFTLR